MKWPLGIITDLFPGKDNVVRCVNVRTAKGTLCRPVQKLHDLEIFYDFRGNEDEASRSSAAQEGLAQGNNEDTDEDEDHEQVQVSRRGRVIRPRAVLDL